MSSQLLSLKRVVFFIIFIFLSCSCGSSDDKIIGAIKRAKEYNQARIDSGGYIGGRTMTTLGREIAPFTAPIDGNYPALCGGFGAFPLWYSMDTFQIEHGWREDTICFITVSKLLHRLASQGDKPWVIPNSTEVVDTAWVTVVETWSLEKDTWVLRGEYAKKLGYTYSWGQVISE